ncbi:beta-lactamase family protein [Aquimarina sp. U1-2]|uniref:serine hydrolase domain-containing protein n=1 Tax=Aquimarina sp. U1-2 TaxID=2823141 RepID=UPI001AED0CDE|nr:serine hydrolase domain-containing protein [Aquimarina sp. U1-2]MBP2831698.1 beta-lactamase family protein [Aquimarina sp. U1-2]
MKLTSVTLIALLSAFFLSSCTKDDDAIANASTLKDEIENPEFVKILENTISDLPENGQIAIAVIDKESTEYIGISNQNKILKRTNNEDNIFEIGSITKVFTSICLSKLIAANQASLTETLQDQFDFPLKEGGEINLKQLANHTSGLPRLPNNVDEIIDFDIKDPYSNYTVDNMKSYLQNHVVLNDINSIPFEYSNTGVGVLGYLLSQKMGLTYEDMLQDLIFEPLQMTNSTTQLSNVNSSKLVKGVNENNAEVSNWNFTDVFAGTGSIKSSVKEMEKFVRKNFEDDVAYNLPQQSTFDLGEGTSIGLGWFILEDEGFKALFHNGATGGYNSYLVMDKSNQRAVVIMINVSSSKEDLFYGNMITEIGNELMESISL